MICSKVLVLCSCLAFPCLAQDSPTAATDLVAPLFPRFQHIAPEDGLTQMRISSILQDRQGYLWLGTLDGGLVRYDGYDFDTFSHDPNDITSISSNAVTVVYEDARGWLWAGTANGLNRFEPTAERFSRIQLIAKKLSDEAPIVVTSISEDTTGALWIGTTIGLFRLSFVDGKSSDPAYQNSDTAAGRMQVIHILPAPHTPESLKNRITAVLVDRTGMIWIGTEQGLGRLLRSTVAHQFVHVASPTFRFQAFLPEASRAHALATNTVKAILEDKDGEIWVLVNSPNTVDLYKIDRFRDSSRTTVYTLPSGPTWYAILDMPVVDHDFLWIGGDSLIVFDVAQQSLSEIPLDKTDLNSPIHFGIRSLFKDESGIIWIGTQWGGLYKYDPFAAFSQYHPALEEIRKNIHDNLRFVFEDSRGNLWLDADKIYRSDRRTGKTNLVLGKTDFPFPVKYFNSIFEDQAHNLWLASEGFGLFRFDPGEQKIVQQFPGKGLQWQGEIGPKTLINVTAVTQDDKGRIWAAAQVDDFSAFKVQKSEAVLYEFNPQNGQSKVYPFDSWSGDYASQMRYYFYDMNLDDSGVVWLASGLGLVRFDPQQAHFEKYQHHPADSNSLSQNQVNAICPDPFRPQRYLWLGTESGGLNRFDKGEESFVHYTAGEGLPSNQISSILSDAQGNLWLATDKGLSKAVLDRETSEVRAFRNYDHADGLYGNNFTFFYGQNAARTARGELIFTGPSGFNIFQPEAIRDNPHAPAVVISDLAINYKPVSASDPDSLLKAPISMTQAITLPYDANTLAFELTALDFRAPQKNRFAFMMEGYDKDWIDNGTSRTVHYTGLPPGAYTFRAKAANSDGVWNEEGTVLRITITPAWWRTWWAYSLYGLLFFGTLYGLRRYERNRQQLKNNLKLEQVQAEKLQEVDRIKSQFFANISHEFRTPLMLILGPAEELIVDAAGEKAKRKARLVHRSAQRLLRLINQLLDLSKLETGKMRLQTSPGDFVSFLKGLVMSFESWAREKGIELRFEVHGAAQPTTPLSPPLLRGESKGGHELMYFDRDKIEKIFTNLLANAIKFTPEGGQVEVTCTLITDCRWGISNSGQGQKYEIRQPKCDVCINNSKANNDQGAPPSVNCVEIRVTDTGRGIPADRLPHIFDRFYQVDASTTRAHEGTGIGLALVKELVEVHNGSIEVMSEEGRGTTFTVCLPLGKEHLKEDEIVEGATPVDIAPSTSSGQALNPSFDKLRTGSSKGDLKESPLEGGVRQSLTGGVSPAHEIQDTREPCEGLKPLTPLNPPSARGEIKGGVPLARGESKGGIDDTIVLIIEDNADVRAYIRGHLEPDYKILEARDGEEGVDKAVETIPDLVISDVMMPNKNGYQVCQALKTDERTSHIPVILLTAKAAAEEKIAGLETGADAYVLKPFRPKELVVRVRKLIEMRRKLRQRFSTATVLKPSEIAATSMDQAFLQQVIAVADEHLDDEQFGLDQLAVAVSMSASQLHRKLRALINQSPGQFLRAMRLQRAADLLRQKAGTVAEIAYQVGFGSQAHFTKMFHKQFGCTPTQYQKRNSGNC